MDNQTTLFSFGAYGNAYPAKDARIQAVSDSSRELYKHKAKSFGTQTERIWAIYSEAKRPLTDREIKYRYDAVHNTSIPASTVSARRNELIRHGFVKKCARRKCEVTRVSVNTYQAK